jgi:hypothetical protein
MPSSSTKTERASILQFLPISTPTFLQRSRNCLLTKFIFHHRPASPSGGASIGDLQPDINQANGNNDWFITGNRTGITLQVGSNRHRQQ